MKNWKLNGLIVFAGLLIVSILLSCDKEDNPVKPTNHAPAIPTINVASGSPGHQSNSQSITPTVKWICSDPDSDALSYDVYFGPSANPALKKEGITVAQYSPGTLAYSTIYYWKITAIDARMAKSESPVWQFTTLAKPVETVTIPGVPAGPNTGSNGEPLTYTSGTANSSSGHSVKYQFDWDDGNLSNWKSGTTASHSWASAGTYQVRAQARCATHTNIVSGWSPAKQVTISIPQNPTLVLSTSTLDFGLNTTSKSFIVSNSGTGTLSWTASVDQPWIQVSPVSGTTTSEQDPVTVSVNRSGLGCGSYTGTIAVSSDGGDITIAVNMQVGGTPQLVVSPSSLDFGSNLTNLCLSLTNTNCACGSCNWSASSSCSWLTLSPSSGTIGCNTVQLCATTSRAGLACGRYSCSITISTSCGQSLVVSVSLKVDWSASLAVSPSSLDFGNSQTVKSIFITNSTSECGVLNWNASTNNSWISINPSAGTTTTETDEVVISADRSSLLSGNYSGSITITSNGGNKAIGVSLEVTGDPLCSISPASLNFGSVEVGSSRDMSFTIMNIGDGILSGSLSELCNEYSIVSGANPYNLASGQSQTVTIRYTPDETGTDNCTIVISGSCDNVVCSGTGFELPNCELNTSSLDFGNVQVGQTKDMSFTITNTGGGTLTGTVSENSTQYDIVSGSGSYNLGTNQSKTITVQLIIHHSRVQFQ